jgi:hypothetical protein
MWLDGHTHNTKFYFNPFSDFKFGTCGWMDTHTHTIPNFTSVHLVISKLEHVGGWTHTHNTKFYFNPFSDFKIGTCGWMDTHTHIPYQILLQSI